MNVQVQQEAIEHMQSMVSMTYGIPTAQVCAWDCLGHDARVQIIRGSGLSLDAVMSYSWVALPLEARKALHLSAQRLKSRGEARLKLITDFVEAF